MIRKQNKKKREEKVIMLLVISITYMIGRLLEELSTRLTRTFEWDSKQIVQ